MSDESHASIEAVLSAFRERNAEGRILASPDWWDLPPEAREAAFEEQLGARHLERIVDARGHSGTVKAVLRRIRAWS